MNKAILKAYYFYSNQKVWLILTLLLSAILIYGEITETRIFDSTSTEHYKPKSSEGGNRNHSNSNVHHK